ncbi:MAG: two-component sensor histidine kinase [Cytophagales bacterium]|nr:two-component sensor histidine kinase [Cytophagales bacterium]
MIIISLIEFILSFVVIGLLLEFLFFRHIKAIYEMFDKMEGDDYDGSNLSIDSQLNPLLRINKELHSYGSRKQEEINRLKERAKFRREFVADISHELKTPLFAAQGFVHTLMDGAVKDKEVRDKFLKNAARSLDGLDMLVEDLLTISQIETGEIKMHFESFDIIALSLKVIEQMEPKAEKKGLRILLENEEDEKVAVQADYRRVYQVLNNLVSNAIKYTKDESDIFLRFVETVSDVQCAVIDRGIGIEEEDLSRIFERFYRVDKSRSKGGTGLGLAIVKHILEGHASQVHVVSKVNKGSTFSFRLIKGNPTEFVEHDEY